MLRKERKKAKTVAEKVAESFLHLNEDDARSESSDGEARVVDFDEEYEAPSALTSAIRKRNVQMLSDQSAKYRGKVSTRKFEESDSSDFDQDEEEQSNSEDDSVDQEHGATYIDEESSGEQTDNDIVSGADDDDDDDDDASDKSEEDYSFECDAEEDSANSKLLREANLKAQLEKGGCVQNQLRIWERLLELRIHSYKLINKCNQLPAPAQLKLTENEELKDALTESSANTTKLVAALLELQHELYGQYSEIKSNLKRTAPFQFEDGDEPPLKRLGEHLDNQFTDFRSYRNSVLLKWDDRTRLIKKMKEKSLNEDYNVICKINNTLQTKSTLIGKTQILKVAEATVTRTSNQSVADIKRDANIYDDSDFYHQQLRELIEYKANVSGTMGEVTKQFMELQKVRQKMKKKVDTRASKGRKLRYIVHHKLINFMAPHDENVTWTDESKNELFSSLFAL